MDDRDDPPYARAPESEDLIRICRALNETGSRYVVIGGFAVIAHGAARFTKDIDFLVDDAPENVARVKRALSVLADNAAADIQDTDIRDFVVVRVADEVVPIASPTTLMRTKDTYRDQDRIDRAFLEGVIKDRRPKPSSRVQGQTAQFRGATGVAPGDMQGPGDPRVDCAGWSQATRATSRGC